jgi:hypothetical protein
MDLAGERRMSDTPTNSEAGWQDTDPAIVAKAAARFLAVDPAFWLERAGLAGLVVSLSGEGIAIGYNDSDVDEANFLTVWLHESPGAARAVTELLRQRSRIRNEAAKRAGGARRGV